MHQSLRRPRVQKKKKQKLFSFQRWVDLRASLTDKRYCSKPLALQEYSFLSSECAANKLHLECYSVVEYANSDYDGYIRLLVLKRCLFLLISYKLPFDLYSIIVQSITLSKMKASVEMEISQNCITTLESLLPRKQFLLWALLFATPQLSSRIITYKLVEATPLPLLRSVGSKLPLYQLSLLFFRYESSTKVRRYFLCFN